MSGAPSSLREVPGIGRAGPAISQAWPIRRWCAKHGFLHSHVSAPPGPAQFFKTNGTTPCR